MANFLSFSPTATLAAAMSSVRRAQELMAQFPPAAATGEDATAPAAPTGTADSAGASAEEAQLAATTDATAAPPSTDTDGACVPAAPTAIDPSADGSAARKRKANALEDDADMNGAQSGASSSMQVEQAQPSPSPSEDMDTSDDARAAGSAVLAQAHAAIPAASATVATSAATAAFLDSIDLTGSPTAMDETKAEGEGDAGDAEEGEMAEEPPPVLQEAEPCTLYTSRGPSAAHAILAASPPPPLPSYAALKAAGQLARTWPFELDAFQQRSVEVLENKQHLLVAAHTSAGKTVVAEYAIAMVFRENEKRRLAQQLQAPGSAANVDAALPPTPRRVIYTAPIKALSNQKYREFKEIFTSAFEEVGLLTGDVMLNPSAPLLIMTTEILRSMLYNGSETLAETDVVVFDEIHYMKDTERGIIWEESIIMLPPSIQCVFLSATLSNAQEFAEWIHEVKSSSRAASEQVAASAAAGTAAAAAATGAAAAAASSSSLAPSARISASVHHRATCHVVYTNTRPIPLTHYMFLKGGAGIYQIKNDRKNKAQAGEPGAPVNNGGAIITANLLKIRAEMLRQEAAKAAEKTAFSSLIKGAAARSALSSPASSGSHFTDKIQAQLAVHRAAKKAHVPDVVRLISLAVEKDWLPSLFFSFSRRECEGMSLAAMEPRWKLDLTTAEEKQCIAMVWGRAMEGLDASDRKLKPLQYMYPLLLRGFAVHHSGLLPLLKEVVEILFQEGLVRVLFCTETFAMGLNMPARCLLAGTEIVFADGSRGVVDAVRKGQWLWGSQGPVQVLEAWSGLSGEMYRVTDSLGRAYTVTPGHQVTLSWRRGPRVAVVPAQAAKGGWREVRASWWERDTLGQVSVSRRVRLAHELPGAEHSRNVFYESAEDAERAAAAWLHVHNPPRADADSDADGTREWSVHRGPSAHGFFVHLTKAGHASNARTISGGSAHFAVWHSRCGRPAHKAVVVRDEGELLTFGYSLVPAEALRTGDLVDIEAAQLAKRLPELHDAVMAVSVPLPPPQESSSDSRAHEQLGSDYSLVLDGDKYRSALPGDQARVVYMLERQQQPIPSEGKARQPHHASGSAAYATRVLETVWDGVLGGRAAARREGIVLTHLSAAAATVLGQVDGGDAEPRHDSVRAVLASNAPVVVAFGEQVVARWLDLSLPSGWVRSTATVSGVVVTTLTRPGTTGAAANAVRVVHAPHTSAPGLVVAHVQLVARAVALAHRLASGESGLLTADEALIAETGLARLSSVRRVSGRQRYFGLRVTGDQRHVLANGILTHNSVVFSQLSKFDGRATRYLQASEYIQMAGRAGRRGVDSKGIVIMMLEKADIEAGADSAVVAGSAAAAAPAGTDPGGMIRHLLTGSTDPLQSKFRLTYNMILNLIRCSSTFDPAYILSQSFLHFQSKNPFKHQRGRAGAPAAPLTTVSGKRARMGEGGISSLSAAGAQAAAKHSSALASVSELQQELSAVDAEIAALGLSPEQQSRVLDFQSEYHRLRSLQDELHLYTLRHPHRSLLPFLQSGRLVYVRQPPVAETNTTASAESKPGVEAVDWGWGIVIHWRMRHAPVRMEAAAADANGPGSSSGGPAAGAGPRNHPAEYVVDVLLPVGVDAATGGESLYRWGEVVVPRPRVGPVGPQSWENGEWNLLRPHSKELRRNNTSVPPPPFHVVNCSLAMLHSLSSVRLYLPPSLLLASPQGVETRAALFKVLDRCTDNFAHRNLPKLGVEDFVRAAPVIGGDSSSSSSSTEEGRSHARAEQRIQAVGSSIASCEALLSSSPVHDYSLTGVQSFLHLHASRTALHARLSSFSTSLSSTHLLSYRIELKTRLRILRRFKHLTAEGVITNKGRIAADIECADELLLTEFLYEGHWTSLNADELAAILTAWLDVEKSSASRLQIPTAPLQAAYAGVRELAQQLSVVSSECGLVLDSARYVASFKSDLIPITYAWVTGNAKSFAELTAMSDLFEGTIIRLFRRLDEMFNQLIKAAQAIGERTLLERLQEGQRKMKRGIMFAGSLYI